MEVLRSTEPMGQNTTVENISPGLKRKIPEDDCITVKSTLELSGSQEKKPKLDAPLVAFKGRKLVFKQESLPKSALSRRDLLNFQTFLLDAEEAGTKVTDIPNVHCGVIVIAGHESMARTEALFVKHLKSTLKVSGDDILPNGIISNLIPRLFAIQDHGFLPGDFPLSSSSSAAKLPAGLQLRCWEARDPENYFSAEQCAVYRTRKVERERARAECLRLLDAMDDVEKLELLQGEKGDEKEKVTKELVRDSPKVEVQRKSREGTANTTESRRSASPVRKGKMTPEEEGASRLRKEEREAKRAVRAEEKTVKEREEERKKALMAKQAQTMSSFFKAKPVVALAPVVSRASPAGPSTPKVSNTSPVASDFYKAFKPVPRRANVEWAEIHRWVRPRRRSKGKEDGEKSHDEPEQDLERWGGKRASVVGAWKGPDFLDDHLRKHGLRLKPPPKQVPNGFKTASPYGTVLDVWNAHQDALDPRKVLNQLKNRHKFPWKTLAFDLQVRPPYSGTFTKKSVAVGPRTPFAQDPTLEYSYDSGDDWQDDEGGDDVDDFDELAGQDEEEGEDESEGEFDDWLDDVEDVPYVPPEGDGDAIVPSAVAPPVMEQGRLPMKVVKKTRELPKRVMKVTPYWKGPMWEKRIGDGAEGMEGFRLQVLNVTPDSIDPFTYVSLDPVQRLKASFSTAIIGSKLGVRCLLSTEALNDLEADMPLAAVDEDTATPVAPSVLPNGLASAPSKPRPSGPKVAFPPSHMPELLRLIEGNTKIRTDLVSQLKAHFDVVTSKAAIEAKIKEVASRQGKAKDSQWRVRPEAWAAAGVPPPNGEIMIIETQ